MLAFLVDSGRALVCPIFHGSNERYAGVMQMTPEEQKIYYRDAEPTWHRELGRTLDYVATRDDLDVESAVYVGMSYGVAFPLPAAIMETRFKAYLLLHGGLVPWSRDLWAPITDMKNYLPRLTRPTFLLSGSYDTIFPVKSQQALYDHIGTVPEDKCWIRTETGHGFISDRELLRIVDWLDERFGS